MRFCFPRPKYFPDSYNVFYKYNTKIQCTYLAHKFLRFYASQQSSKSIIAKLPNNHLKKTISHSPALIICPYSAYYTLPSSMRATTLIRYTFARHTRYCILGGGSGGLNISTHLLRSGVHPSEIRLIDPAHNHYYQPGWTMVGAGMWQIHST